MKITISQKNELEDLIIDQPLDRELKQKVISNDSKKYRTKPKRNASKNSTLKINQFASEPRSKKSRK